MFEDISNAFKRVSVKRSFKDALFNVAPEMELLNRGQLLEGKKSTGENLSPYSEQYAKKRRKKGLQTSKKDLYFDGTLHKNIYAKAYENFIEFGGKTKTAEYMEAQESKDIFGLTDSSLEKIIPKVIELTVQFSLDDLTI